MANSTNHTGWRRVGMVNNPTALAAIYDGTELFRINSLHLQVTGNVRLGAVSAFGTTEPTSALVMKEGTNPVGAITTSGGIFVTTGGATISKIIAAGTVNQIET